MDVAVEAFVDTDKQYLQVDDGTNRDDGCTAVTAVLVKQHLVVANVGDSRAVLSRRGKGGFAAHTRLHHRNRVSLLRRPEQSSAGNSS